MGVDDCQSAKRNVNPDENQVRPDKQSPEIKRYPIAPTAF